MNGMIKSLLGVAIIGSAVVADAQTKFPLRVDVDVSTLFKQPSRVQSFFTSLSPIP